MKLETSSFDLPEQPFAFEEIQELVYHGATSLSYKVRIHNKWHFLKRPKLEFADNPLYIYAFEKEFDLGFRLDHPFIVRYISKGSDKDGIYILTEFVDGVTLTEFIKFNPDFAANRKDVKRLLLQLCEALRYLHSHNIIHYDLKPDNILITRSGYNIKLIDLGFSYSDCYEALACGTKNFSAPEQFSAPEKCDVRSDIYSFGRIIEFIFHGKPPHKYKSIYYKAIQEDIDNRQHSVDEIMHALSANNKKWIAISFLIAIPLIIVLYVIKSVTDFESAQRFDRENSSMPTVSVSFLPTENNEEIQSSELSIETISKEFRDKIQPIISDGFSEFFNTYTEITYSTSDSIQNAFIKVRHTVDDKVRPIYIEYTSRNEVVLDIPLFEVWEAENRVQEAQFIEMYNKYVGNSGAVAN